MEKKFKLGRGYFGEIRKRDFLFKSIYLGFSILEVFSFILEIYWLEKEIIIRVVLIIRFIVY